LKNTFRQNFGKEGENKAWEFLKNKKYELLEMNFRHKKSEIDLIVKNRDTLVFCEVKTRSTFDFGFPETFVSAKQKEKIQLGAEYYIQKIFWEGKIRFDILSVELKDNELIVTHFEDAF